MEIIGNLLGLLLFLAFQGSGLVIIFSFLNKNTLVPKLLFGSVLGTVLMQWFPCFFAFFIGFTTTAQLLGLLLAIILAFLVAKKFGLEFNFKTEKISKTVIYLGTLVYLILVLLALHGFRISDNAIYSSQCTFGDMNMHLGFITSIATSTNFPPVYSIFPMESLSYPFLCDSISSSIYVFGSSLRFAYLLPMVFAFAQVIVAFILIMKIWLKDDRKVALAIILFFFNGGFGIYYFINGDFENFTRIFTAFYETPTNYTSENISWVNVMVDMLIPQRATLFGWSVLFPCIALLLQNKKRNFIVLGFLAGALPLIHTHSFLALAIISACYLVASLCKNSAKPIKVLLLAFPVFFAVLQFFIGYEIDFLMYLSLALVVLILGVGLVFAFKNGVNFSELKGWIIFLSITLVLALPQLFGFTFTQSDGFVRSCFNWNNNGADGYILFYIKNLGLMALLYYPAVLYAKKRSLQIASPIIIIMLLSEMMVFQPNVYDNNKLILVAYLFLCGLVADFVIEKFFAKKIILGFTILIFSISAVLTIAREFNASYELYGEEALDFVEYIKENTEPDDIFMTNDRHNNEISSLSGRNILCGSPSYLYYHGVDYSGVASMICNMYENPSQYYEYFESFGVDYVVVSSYELNNYNVNLEEIEDLFELVYESSSIKLYKV